MCGSKKLALVLHVCIEENLAIFRPAAAGQRLSRVVERI